MVGLPLDNLLNMARPVTVRDPDSRTDDAWGLDIKHRTLDARIGP
jgi:hypothetical protein